MKRPSLSVLAHATATARTSFHPNGCAAPAADIHSDDPGLVRMNEGTVR